jgi:hypothetical protein
VNINLLIDAMVRQTTVLIAQMATSGGARAPLAHTANRVFLDLVRELKEQGLGSKVISDMFGLTLRAYHAKVARLSESGTERGKSLSEALFEYVQTRGATSRNTILERFSRDEEIVVGAVLRDLVDTGLLSRSGRGDRAVYRVAVEETDPEAEDTRAHLANLVWVVVHRYGPVDIAAIAQQVPGDAAALSDALEQLTREGRVEALDGANGPVYSTHGCVIPLGSPAGWEAAVFDHYQAVVTALCTKLRLGRSRAVPGEWLGGSTYSFHVWEGNPHREAVLGFLQRTRDEATGLRRTLEAYNATHPAPDEGMQKVIFYAGQTVLGLEEDNGGDE